MIDELFPMYIVWNKTHLTNNSKIMAASGRDAVFHTISMQTVCYSVPSIVEVSGGCQSANICLCQ